MRVLLHPAFGTADRFADIAAPETPFDFADRNSPMQPGRWHGQAPRKCAPPSSFKTPPLSRCYLIAALSLKVGRLLVDRVGVTALQRHVAMRRDSRKGGV